RAYHRPDGLEELPRRGHRRPQPRQDEPNWPGLEQEHRLRVLPPDRFTDQLARIGLADRERVHDVAEPAELLDFPSDEGVARPGVVAGQVRDRGTFRHCAIPDEVLAA